MAAGNPSGIDPKDYARIMNAAKNFDKELGLSLRRRIRVAAQPLAERVKKKADTLEFKNTAGGNTNHTGLRKNLRRSIVVSSLTPKRGSGGVIIAARSRKMPAGQKTLIRAVSSKKGWRHPVFDKGGWAKQENADPDWFYGTLSAGAPIVRVAVQEALHDAVKAVDLD